MVKELFPTNIPLKARRPCDAGPQMLLDQRLTLKAR
jgi:hypothetical protein